MEFLVTSQSKSEKIRYTYTQTHTRTLHSVKGFSPDSRKGGSRAAEVHPNCLT